MPEKIVSSIKETEKSAKGIIENRKKQNLADIEEARAKVKEKLSTVNAAKQKSILSAQSRADEDAKKDIQALKDEYGVKISGLNDIAKRNIEESVKFIISKI